MQAKNASPRILGAARAIAHREGAGKITIDAVAREADLSKGGVLYNCRVALNCEMGNPTKSTAELCP